jgi:hypothetical protein
LKKTRETYNLRHRYGIEAQQKNDIISKQNNVCAICRKPFKNKLDTNVDHCHTTKKLRGVLCRGCNIGLGKFKDSPELLRFAAIYLEYHVKQNQLTPIPTECDSKSQDNATHGTVYGTRFGEDCDGAHHHLGGIEGDNPHRGTETSGGVGMGSGVSEMGTPKTLQGGESNGYAKAEAVSIREFVEYICDESRKLGLVVRAEQEVRLPDYRRELEVQGSVNEKVQGTQEAPQIIQETINSYRYAISTGSARSLVPSWDIGFGATIGDKPDKV